MRDTDAEKIDTSRMNLWDHLAELSRRLKIVLYSILVTTVLMMTFPANLQFLKNPFEFYDPLIGVILRTIRVQVLSPDVRLIGVDLTAPIQLYVVASAVFGVCLSMPVIAYEVYTFVAPAFYPNEKRGLYPFIVSFTLMFVAGAVFGYKVLSPFLIWAMMPFYSVVGAEQMISILDFYNIVFITVFATGLTFTMPIFLVLLVKYNIVSTRVVTRNRFYLYAALYVVTAILTPDGGPVGDMILFAPIAILMELGVIFAKRYEKGRTSPTRFRIFKPQTCRFCGRDMTLGATFCNHCGKSQV